MHIGPATGAKLNLGKSKALLIEPWDVSESILGFPGTYVATILGIRFTSKIAH